jgi:protein-S-isoprenylcysteine O-methyltransferase Ste14
MKNEASDNAGVIAPPPLIYIVTFAAGILLHRKFPARSVVSLPRKLRFVLAGSLIGVALATSTQAFLTMRRAHTSIDPRQPTTAIVVDGPYRFTRNPIYLSLTLLYSGLTVLFNVLSGLLLLPIALIILQRGVIEREEKYLERKFGEQYLSYKQQVRRWL